MIGFITLLNPINNPFVLALYSPFLTEMRIALGALDLLSRAYLGYVEIFSMQFTTFSGKINIRLVLNEIYYE